MSLQNRRQTFLYRISTIAGPELAQLFKDHEGFYATSEDNPIQISYARELKYTYDNKRRIKGKLGKAIKRIAPSIKDHDIEKLVNKYNAFVEGDLYFSIRDDIRGVYDNGPGSCMSGEDSDKVEIYETNDLEILTYEKEGVIKGRALLWPTRITGLNRVFMDRVYPPELETAFKKYAVKHNYLMRESNALPDGDVKILDKDWNNIGSVNITLNCVGIDNYPYIDTFHYCTSFSHGDEISLTNCETSGHIFCMSNTDGEIEDNRAYCDLCYEYHDEDESQYIDNVGQVCPDCLRSNFIQCDDCGEHIHIDTGNYYSDSNGYKTVCKDCFEQSYTYCEHCEDMVRIEDTQYVSEEKTVCDGCIDESDYFKCPECNEYHLTDKGEEVIINNAGDSELYCGACCNMEATYCDVCEQTKLDRMFSVNDYADGERCFACEKAAQEKAVS